MGCTPAVPAALGLATAVVLVLFALAQQQRGDHVDAEVRVVPATSQAALTTVSATIQFTNAYGPRPAARFYPWEHVVEPHTTTTLSAALTGRTEGMQCRWSVTLNGASDPSAQRRQGCTPESGAVVHFSEVGRTHTVELQVVAGDAARSVVLATSTTAMCKYVRREIRALSQADRSKYFAALEVVHRAELEDGRSRFGSKFKNFEYFTTKHMDAINVNDCFPYVGPFHGSNSFLTSHAAFTLELEQALQSVDPTVTQPYWDFTIDADALGADWAHAQMFSFDWFGSAALGVHEGQDSFSVLNSSRWFSQLPAARVKLVSDGAGGWRPQDESIKVFNSYGLITNNPDRDDARFVTRVGSICGLPTKTPLGGLQEVLGCMALQTLDEWRACFETDVHAYAHTMLGGAWDCPFSLKDMLIEAQQSWGQNDKRAAGRAEFLALNSINIWKVAFAAGTLTCPAACADGTPHAECACTCPALVTTGSRSSDELDWSHVRRLLDESNVLRFLMNPLKGTQFLAAEPGARGDNASALDYRFVGLDDQQNERLMRFLLDFTCSPGKLGHMSTDGSPNDPIFWPLHLLYDRAWQQIRLDPSYDHFNHTWAHVPDGCPGYNAEDLLPFSLAAIAAAPDAYDSTRTVASNRELYAFFDPENEQLPYVYDSFAFAQSPLVVAD